jgi:hypothetical protein
MADFQARLEAANARKAAAALTEEEQAEVDVRATVAAAEAAAEAAEKIKRDLDLDRRLETARAARPGDTFKAVAIKGCPDTFIVRRVSSAFAAWQAETGAAKELDTPAARTTAATAARLRLAVASVWDWNGNADQSAEATGKLLKYLSADSGPVIPITDAAIEMAHVIAEAAKS